MTGGCLVALQGGTPAGPVIYSTTPHVRGSEYEAILTGSLPDTSRAQAAPAATATGALGSAMRPRGSCPGPAESAAEQDPGAWGGAGGSTFHNGVNPYGLYMRGVNEAEIDLLLDVTDGAVPIERYRGCARPTTARFDSAGQAAPGFPWSAATAASA